MDYVVLGQLLTDDILYAGGPSYLNLPGGVAYTLAGIRYWSDSLGVCSGLGTDFLPTHGAWLRAAGVDLKGTWEEPVRSPHTRCVYRGGEERQEEPVPGTAPLSRMMPRVHNIPRDYDDCKGLYVYLGHEPSYWEELSAWKRDKRAVLLWELRGSDARAENRPAFRRYLETADILSLNYAEALALTEEREPERMVRSLLALGARKLFLHMGAEGALAADAGTCWKVSVWPSEVVDVTGCGNASAGGFLAGYCESDGDLEWAGRCGNTSASFMLEQFGPPAEFTPVQMQEARRRAGLLRAEKIY